MLNKKFLYSMILMFCLISISMVSAVKPLTSVTSDVGYQIKPTQDTAIVQGENHSFEIHVFNITNGYPITSGITCYMHLYHDTGKHLLIMQQDTPDHIFDYGFDVGGGNLTSLGQYEAKFQCNNSAKGLAGESQLYFLVNGLGDELTTANSIRFNSAMFFMMVLFIMAIVGLFATEHYIGKFAFYWVAHLLFIAGTFAMWQFNIGYATNFIGLASIWKILFYISTFAVFPIIIFSLFWIFYIHTFNEHFEKIIRNGGNTEEAFRIAERKSGGWWNGKK